MLGRFGEVVGGQNGSQNRFLGGFLPCFFRMPFLKRFFGDFCRFLKVRTLILVRTANVLEDFHEIDVFEKVAKMCRFWLRFRRSKTRKIEKKTVLKNIIFFTSNFKRFFADFFDFGSILGGPGPSKKLLKIEKNREQNRF